MFHSLLFPSDLSYKRALFNTKFRFQNFRQKYTKIAKGIGIISRAKKYLYTIALINLYHAFIFPYLIYCVEVWGNALSKHVQPLIKLQNKILDYHAFT